MQTAKLHVKGIVQGVSFRAFAKRNADALQLKGYVKNHGDESVEIYIEGPKTLIEQFIETINEGPPGSSVKKVDVDWSFGKGMFSDFKIVY